MKMRWKAKRTGKPFLVTASCAEHHAVRLMQIIEERRHEMAVRAGIISALLVLTIVGCTCRFEVRIEPLDTPKTEAPAPPTNTPYWGQPFTVTPGISVGGKCHQVGDVLYCDDALQGIPTNHPKP